MIELLFMVCMIDEPSRCKEERMTFEVAQTVTPAQCAFNGQLAVAGWLGDHPKWTLKDMKCVPAGQVAKI